LLLAGDIGNTGNPTLYQFLDYCSQNWENVYYVPGNHEFYVPDNTFIQLNAHYKKVIGERYKNVHYLDSEFVALTDDINLYGSTFWTRQISRPFHKYDGFADHLYLSKDEVTALSIEQETKLRDYLSTNTKKTIVMTHFPPLQTNTSNPRFANNTQETKDYFAWNPTLLGDVNWNNVIGWISGHTHYSYDFIDKGNVRFFSNQMGYKGEVLDASNNLFNEDGLYEL
jgi:predicted phosphohydrolase